jgi:hypothetical protein
VCIFCQKNVMNNHSVRTGLAGYHWLEGFVSE